MKIKVLEKTPGCYPMEFFQGDWIDLLTAEDIKLKAPEAHKMHIRGKDKENTGERTREVDFQFQLIKLGVAMELPKGYEAILAPRSSSFKKWGIIQVNSIGVIDWAFNSSDDEWMMAVMATRTLTIPRGTRIAQFRIQLSQKATLWQKIKWLFSSKPKLVAVDSLDNEQRGGFGSTNK